MPGYSKIGYGLRHMTWEKDDPRPDALRGKTVVVTGASSGLGKAAAAAMARLGGSVHPVVRDLREAISETETAHRPGPHDPLARPDLPAGRAQAATGTTTSFLRARVARLL